MNDGSWMLNGTLPVNNITPNIAHDLSLLGITTDSLPVNCSEIKISEAISRTKIFRWLAYNVHKHTEKEIYFGETSALLHDALLDDPKPYRSEVKELLANLLAWIKVSPKCGLTVDKPGYSERISIKKD